MPVPAVASSTGPTPLPDLGRLAYNGVQFSALYHSALSGRVVEDDARRITKLIEWTLRVEGTVTLPDGAPNTDDAWMNLRKKLEAQGAGLTYQGNGSGTLNVGFAAGPIGLPGGGVIGGVPGVQDVAWGPVPRVLSFTPYGAGRGAKIEWEVVVRVFEVQNTQSGQSTLTSAPGGLPLPTDPLGMGPVLQYNYESTIAYDEQGYSSLAMRGTLEIPLSSLNLDAQRRLQKTVDNYRQKWLNIVVDLTKFRVVRRTFDYSRDKRTVQFEFAAEELPYMGLPVGHTDARGTMTMRPMRMSQQGPYLTGVRWALTLRATYCVARNYPRRTAWQAFYALLAFRMKQSALGKSPARIDTNSAVQEDPPTGIPAIVPPTADQLAPLGNLAAQAAAGQVPLANFYRDAQSVFPNAILSALTPKAIMIDFGFEEGLYLDSKTITFEASWALFVRFQDVLKASGLWRWAGPETSALPNARVGGNPWAMSVKDISGWKSWLVNKLDPSLDVIVDMNGGDPPVALGGIPPQ